MLPDRVSNRNLWLMSQMRYRLSYAARHQTLALKYKYNIDIHKVYTFFDSLSIFCICLYEKCLKASRYVQLYLPLFFVAGHMN